MRDSETLCGWTGRLLHVDLTPGPAASRCQVRALDPERLRERLGGRGLGADLVRPGRTLAWDDPNAPVAICAGALAATLAPVAGRAHLTARSPLSPGAGDAPVGGRLAAQLRRAGFDALLITGRSPEPCGLEIADGEVRIVRADELSGLGTRAVFRRLARFGSVACVGPAAEQGSPLAAVAVDRFHAARGTGLGLSLAAKNFKYLAVSGTGRIRVADKAALLRARRAIVRLTNASPALLGRLGLGAFGTPAFHDLTHARRMMPTDHFRSTRFEPAPGLNAFALRERFHPERRTCAGCHVACKRVAGDAALPEFASLSHFTALINNPDLELAVRADVFCADQGLDPVLAAALLARLREARGRDFGPGEVEALLAELAAGRDFAGELCAAPAMTVKGLPLGPWDPRGAYGTALACAVATRGGCAQRAFPVSHEVLRKPVATDRFTFSGKARMIKIAEDRNAALDSLGVCGLAGWAVGLEPYAAAYAAVTGLGPNGASARALARLGERVVYEERAANALNGLTAQDDDLPERFFRMAGTGGEGIEVAPLDRAEFLEARARYYRIRGLDENGLPTRDKARELGVEWNAS